MTAKPFNTFFLIVFVLSLGALSVHAQDKTGSAFWKQKLEDTGSVIAYTAWKMLREKEKAINPEPTPTPTPGSRRRTNYDAEAAQLQRLVSKRTIRTDIYGKMWDRNQRGILRELDLITGKQAIRETLQLGSIGSGFDDEKPHVAIKSIQPLQVNSHPWEEMLQTVSPGNLSDIFQLVPDDHFVLHFQDLAQFKKTEASLREIFGAGEHYADMDEVFSIRKKVASRLGIEKFEKLEPMVGEIVFVSEDLSFFPRTEYALILGFKTPLAGAFSEYLSSDRGFNGKIGNYKIISSSKGLLEKIEAAAKKEVPSMKEAKDFAYAMAVLDSRRDGSVYLSEKFILKLVSPEYRINAARRNRVMNRLEALQYSVFAYRYIHEQWPASLKVLGEQGYVDVSALGPEYTVVADGIVEHKEWGSLYAPQSVSAVSIEMASKAEQQDYDRFRNGYQRFWRRFFDPIGIGITLRDLIYFHTIILPLIDQSEYNMLKAVATQKEGGFQALEAGTRFPPVVFYSGFDFDQLVLAIAEEGRAFRKHKGDLSDAEKRQIVNDEFNKDIKTEKPLDLFGMIGNEMTIGLGADIPLALGNIADLDFYIGFQLKDRSRFEDFINSLYSKFFKDFRGSGGGLPFLQLSSEKPLQNEYNGVKYSIIPSGFVNLYYFFQDDYVYFAISQLAINRLIDGQKAPGTMSSYQQRALDYVGEEGNLLLVGDLHQLKNFKNSIGDSYFLDWTFKRRAWDLRGYLSDIELIAQSVSADERLLRKYFRRIPEKFYGVPVQLEQGRIFLGRNEKKKQLREVELGSARYYYRHRDNNKEKLIPFVDLIDEVDRDIFRKGLEKLKAFGLALTFTEEGLDSKIVVQNPLSSELAADFPQKERKRLSPPGLIEGSGENGSDSTQELADPMANQGGDRNSQNMLVYGAGAVLLLLVFFIAFMLGRRSRNS